MILRALRAEFSYTKKRNSREQTKFCASRVVKWVVPPRPSEWRFFAILSLSKEQKMSQFCPLDPIKKGDFPKFLAK